MNQADTSLLEAQFIRNMERARQDRAVNGEYTRAGLEALVNAATCQFKMYRMTEGAEAQRHKDTAADVLTEAYQQAKKLGIIMPGPAEADAPVSQPVPSQPKPAPVAAVKTEKQDDEEDPEKALQNLVGLSESKEALSTIINSLMVNRMREEHNLKAMKSSMHMVFTGHAGTGKTTVARLVGGILKKHNILSKGHMVEVNANNLVKGYVGHSAEATRKAGEEAIGGILFIDEAYAIAKSKFVDEIVPTLLSIMEDNRKDLCVIIAGYTDEMREFVESNEGVKSRFLYWVNFPDYSADEMLTIFERMCKSNGQTVTPEAKELLLKTFEARREDTSFGNARGVRNIFEKANLALSNRLAKLMSKNETITTEMLSTITEQDVREAAEQKSDI